LHRVGNGQHTIRGNGQHTIRATDASARPCDDILVGVVARSSNGCVQLGLFVVGMWMRHACRGNKEEEEGCCAWCECCLDEEEKALRREKQTQDRIDQAVSEYEAYSHVGPPPAGPAPNPPTPPLRTSMSNPRMSQNTSGRMPSNPRSSIMRQSTGQRYNSML
jgi:hypothetical protein